MNPRVPPHSIEAEEAVIGSILIDPEVLLDIMEILQSKDFYFRKNKLIFSSMEELFDRGDPVDIVTVTDKMRVNGTLEEIGGEIELAKLTDVVPTSANIEYYAKTVKEKALLRALISAGSKLVEEAYDSSDTDTILDNAEKMIFEVTEGKATKTYQTLGKVTHSLFEDLEVLKDKATTLEAGGLVTGTPTGFKELDKSTTGFHPSELIILAARPGMGKTAFALNVALNMSAKHNTPTAFFCLEMTKQQLAQRLLCSQAGIDLQKVRTGNINDEEWKLLTKAGDVLYRSKLIVDDDPYMDPRSLRAKARRIKLEYGIKVMFLDYLQLMHVKGRSDSRQQEISEISRSMKLLARELDITVVALSQLSRAVEQRDNKRPRLSDLRESGAIEQDADMVMFIYRDDYYKQKERDQESPPIQENQETEIIIGKQRNGPIGTVSIMFKPRTTTFFNMVSSNRD